MKSLKYKRCVCSVQTKIDLLRHIVKMLMERKHVFVLKCSVNRTVTSSYRHANDNICNGIDCTACRSRSTEKSGDQFQYVH